MVLVYTVLNYWIYQRCSVGLLLWLFYNSQASFVLGELFCTTPPSDGICWSCPVIPERTWSFWLARKIKWGQVYFRNYRDLLLLHLLRYFYTSLWCLSIRSVWVGKHLHVVKVWHHITALLDVDVLFGVFPYLWHIHRFFKINKPPKFPFRGLIRGQVQRNVFTTFWVRKNVMLWSLKNKSSIQFEAECWHHAVTVKIPNPGYKSHDRSHKKLPHQNVK